MTSYSITPKGRELMRRMTVENPCDRSSPEYDLWSRGVFEAMMGEAASDMPPAYLEGVEWWNDFSKEWKDGK